jgi:hypothetical protein
MKQLGLLENVQKFIPREHRGEKTAPKRRNHFHLLDRDFTMQLLDRFSLTTSAF